MQIPDDRRLTQIVDAAVADAVRRSGTWVACRQGCTQCCHGPFSISHLDAARLRDGLKRLGVADPDRAARVQQRAREWVTRNGGGFPGDSETGILRADAPAFEDWGDDEPCPVLDPLTGLCDLYDYRPLTCRLFGPPLRMDAHEIGVCELCFDGASDTEIARCAVDIDVAALEAEVLAGMEPQGDTIVAFCLAR